MLLERLADAEQSRRDQDRERQRHDDGRADLTNKRVEEVVGPVVHVGRPRQGRLGEMMQRMDVAPEELVHV